MLNWKPSLDLPKRGMETFVHLIFLISLSESFVTEDIEEVYGVEGESIVINCTYSPEKNQWKEKSWCKHISEMECQHIVSARRFWMPFLKRRNGTTAIADNIQKGILTITIDPLQKQDAGLYQCKTAFLGIVNTLQKVKVKVLTEKWKIEEFEVVKTEHSISSTKSYADDSLHIFVAGFLCFKLLVAAVILIIAKSKKMRAERSQENEYQLFPIAGELLSFRGQEGIQKMSRGVTGPSKNTHHVSSYHANPERTTGVNRCN